MTHPMHYELTYLGPDRFRPIKQHIKKDEVRLYASIVAEDSTISRAFITFGNTTIVWSKSWDARADRDKIMEYLVTYCGYKRF